MDNVVDKEPEKPRVGLGIMIRRDDSVLLGKRKGSHGEGEWCFPGGHLEFVESFMIGVMREVAEECGVKVKNIQFQCVANIKKYNKHHVLVGFSSDFESGEAKVLESDKCEKWERFPADNLPEPIFEGSRIILESYKTGRQFFDS